MSTAPVTSKLAVVTAGEPTLFDSLARLVPEELQAEYYRVLAHTRTLSPDDEMLRILEAMGILALLTRQTPKDIADERERFQEMLDLNRQFSNEAQQKMLGYVHELEARISALPGEIEAGLDSQQIAKLLGESLRQHFLQSGITATVNGLQTTNAALTAAQKELSTALRNLSDSRGGVVAQVESANNRLTYSLESRAKTVDALLHELKNDVLRIWIPMACGAALLIGLFAGIEIEGCRDASLAAVETPAPTVAQPATSPPDGKSVPDANSGKLHHDRREAKPGVEAER
jgi:vacuolar-type H+-ATPase subunit E/Vma4